MSGSDCMIETDSGVFDCGLDTQLKNLTKDIRHYVPKVRRIGMDIIMTQTYEKYLQLGEKIYFTSLGKVTKIVGLTIESVGPKAKLNDLCRIVIDEEKKNSVLAEVVGFRDKRLFDAL